MGNGGGSQQGLSLSNLHEILGNAMPELPRDQVGRHRLVRALNQRFGPNFRSLPGIKNLISEFDGEINFEARLQQLKQIKYKPKKE